VSAQTATVTGVVEQMLGHAAARRWDALPDVLDEQFTILEPVSLPYGGAHHGVDGYVALMEQIIATFELEFQPHGLYALDEHKVLLHMDVTFTARATGRRITLPVVELLDVVGARVRRSEVFISDTAALLATLGG
jgi:uncharacterized protein